MSNDDIVFKTHLLVSNYHLFSHSHITKETSLFSRLQKEELET